MAGCRWLFIGLVDEVAKLVAARDTELGVGTIQVGGDGAGGQEQLVGDLAVGQATACQDHDLPLLSGELGERAGYGGGDLPSHAAGAQFRFGAPGPGGGGGYLADDGAQDRSLAYQRLVRELLEAQRHEIVRLRNRGEISNQVMHRIRPADDSFL
jgi:hypothetical protein